MASEKTAGKKRRACPFCQHWEQQVRKVEVLDDDYYAVFCLNCDARGSLAINENAAWAAWSKDELRHLYDKEESEPLLCVCGDMKGNAYVK